MSMPLKQIAADGASSGNVFLYSNGKFSPGSPSAVSRATTPSVFWSNQYCPFVCEQDSAGWGTANQALFIPFAMPSDETAKRMGYMKGDTITGNVDVGIYDSSGNRLVSSGSTAVSANANEVQMFNISDTALVAGLYFMAIVFDSAASTVQSWESNSTTLSYSLLHATKHLGTAFPLPATASWLDAPETLTVWPRMAVLLEA